MFLLGFSVAIEIEVGNPPSVAFGFSPWDCAMVLTLLCQKKLSRWGIAEDNKCTKAVSGRLYFDMLQNLLVSCCFVELHSQVKRVNVFIEGFSQKIAWSLHWVHISLRFFGFFFWCRGAWKVSSFLCKISIHHKLNLKLA